MYQSVNVPRFYVNCIELMDRLGLIQNNGSFEMDKYYTISASNPQYHGLGDGYNDGKSLPRFKNSVPYNRIMGDRSFFAYLGHNFKEADTWVGAQEGIIEYTPTYNSDGNSGVNNVINCGVENWHIKPPFDGFSIFTCDISHWQQTTSPNQLRFESGDWDSPDDNPYNGLGGPTIGAIIIGTYYDMKAPNLSLTVSREYETNEFTTYNGSSMSNTMWRKPPDWGNNAGAWELHEIGAGSDWQTSDPALSRSGRKTWGLKFSHVSDGDLWGSNQSLSNPYGPGDNPAYYVPLYFDANMLSDDVFVLPLQEPVGFLYNLLTDDNFFSQVWHKTLGGSIPFIFQPDGGANGNNNPDQYSICRFKDNSLKATQSSFNTYDISISIEECW
tara:strand:+ start:6595 stop:7749 length:1155 start_codon:yes stop_codon:yes gene_type:complete